MKFMFEKPLSDYYAILQVHPEAEPEVIEAAYRRLMQKYHPDRLPEDQRANPDVLARVRAINVAYDCLGDPQQRMLYDRMRLAAEVEDETPPADLAMRVLLIRCATTKKTYKMLLAKKIDTEIFQVMGFEPYDSGQPLDPAQLNAQPETPRLPPPERKTNLLENILAVFRPSQAEPSRPPRPEPRFPPMAEIKSRFQKPSDIGFNHIDWGDWTCPACEGEYFNNDGIISTWLRCSRCSRIYCAGGMRTAGKFPESKCPWCGRKALVTRRVKPGEQVDMPLSGEIPGQRSPKKKLFKDGGRPNLPSKT
jgi:DNA-directed RNA polymerase subunit RPC12/RpoP